MRWIVAIVLLVVASLAWNGREAPPDPGVFPDTSSGSLLDLLPDSTLVAAELRDVDRRWSALRSVAALAGFQNRLLHGSGLEPDDLPLLAGNRAALALVPARDGRTVIPVAVLRPPDPDRAEAILDVRAGARPEGDVAWCRARGRNALWVGPASAADDVIAVARGDGTSLGPLLPVEDTDGRLPAGGLVRGWVHVPAVRRFLQDLAPGTLPPGAELIAAAAAAEFDAVRWIRFRRDVVGSRLVTDAVVSYDLSRLPLALAEIFDPGASSPPLPAELPEDLVYITAFRPEARSWLPWLRYLQESDPRGPFRNAGFWIDEFEQRSGLDLRRDLLDLLGEHGWELLLEGSETQPVQWAAVIEASDAKRVEATLLELRDWAAEHAVVRSLGLVRLLDLPVPSFAAAGEYVVIGIGDRAVSAALDLAASGSLAVGAIGSGDPAFHLSLVVRGPALARTLEPFVGQCPDPWAALLGLLSRVDEASLRVIYQRDGLRVHGEAFLSS